MTILWTISNSYEVLSFIPPCWESWLGVSPFGILTKQALKWDVKTLGSGCMSLGWNLAFTGFVTFLNLSFLICTVGMQELLHRVGVRMREDGVQDQGQRLVHHSALRTRPEFPSVAVAAGWARSPTSISQWSILYPAATVILLTLKSQHITSLLKTFSGFPLTWSKSWDHHSSLKIP